MEGLQKGLELAYAYINRRERTVAEVRSQLERKGVDSEHADAVVATLVEQRLLDDARFAEMFVHDKRELEQWGSERIRRGLVGRGVDRELAESALVEQEPGATQAEPGTPQAQPGSPEAGSEGAAAPFVDGDKPTSELGRALTLLRRRFPLPPADRRERDRALGVLLRKGYEPELALDALSAYARDD